LRPVFVKTGEDGTAFIGPLDASVELTRYHILALADGYCTYLSAPSNNFSLIEKTPPVVILRTCADQSGGSNALVPSFPEKLKYLKIDGRDVVHTKDDSLFLRIDSLTPNLRGAKVEVFETDNKFEPSLEAIEGAREVSIFQSEFSIPLPKIFKKTDSTEGKFIIKVSRSTASSDNADAFPPLVIFGHKKVGPPSRDLLMKVNLAVPVEVEEVGGTIDEVDDWTNVKIVSVSGHTNVVPGLAGSTFTMQSPICNDGDSLGFSIPAYSMIEPVFKECVKGVATFTAEEAGFIQRAAKIAQAGGRQRWNVFMKDKFGNVSESLDDPNAISPKRLNVVTVIIDTGRPVITDDDQSVLLGDIDMKINDTNAPSTLNPLTMQDLSAGKVTMHFDDSVPAAICLPSGTPSEEEMNLNGKKGGNATFLQQSIGSYVYRDDLNRLSVRTLPQDAGGKYEEIGMLIYKWVIGGTADAVSTAPLSDYTRCRESDGGTPAAPVSVRRTLKLSDFTFKEDDTAEFYMRYMDVSGLLSKPIRYSIPKCSGGSGVCWDDDPPPP
jgi:hypothetical protein